MKKYYTFEEWKQLGYYVMKGEKAKFFNTVPKFSSQQVKKKKTQNFKNYIDDNHPYGDNYDTGGYATGMGVDWGI